MAAKILSTRHTHSPETPPHRHTRAYAPAKAYYSEVSRIAWPVLILTLFIRAAVIA